MPVTAKEILQHIASKDFFDRLCAVRVDEGWWPALKYSSLTELTTALNEDFGGPDNTRRVKAIAALEWRKKSEDSGLAYLMRLDYYKFMLLPQSKPELVADFYDHYEAMSDTSKQLKDLLDLVLKRVEGGLEPQPADGARMSPVLACAPVRPELAGPSEGKSKDVLSVHESGYVPTTEKKAVKSSEGAAKDGKKKGRASRKKEPVAVKVEIKKEESKAETPEKEEDDNFPVSEVLGSNEKDPVSPLKFSGDGESVSIANASKVADDRISRHVPLADKSVSWHVFFQSMKDSGWTHLTGSGLISYYWVHPLCSKMKKNELLANGVEGEDYFTSEEAVKLYAKKAYGWEGQVESPMSTNPGLDIGDKVKKSRRSRNTAAKRDLTKPPATSTKKNPREAAPKKEASRSTASASFDGSRFSLGGSVSEKSGVKGKKLNYGGKKVAAGSPATNTTAPCSEISSPCSVDSSVDNTYQMMKSGDAWKLLISLFGFSYTRGKYCLPGSENRPTNASAQEGMHFFSTIEDLRKHLCAFGLPKSKKALSDEEKLDISRWVRYAHVINLADGACINEEYIGEPIKQNAAWVLLQRLGLKYSTGYVIPKSTTHAYKKFERAEEFYKYLARFGIPRCDDAPGPELTANERLVLDLFVYNWTKNLNTFERINPQSNEITPRRTRQNASNLAPDPTPPEEFVVNAKDAPNRKKKEQSMLKKEFDVLYEKRDLPTGLIGSQKATELLQQHYGIGFVGGTESSVYCFTDPLSNEEVKFNTLQDLRENLCAYGLPRAATNLNEEDQFELESWIRCAHMKGLGDPASIPQYTAMTCKKVKDSIRALGYQMSKDFSLYVLPGADFHNPTMGKDGWNSLIAFINHVARFGLAEPSENDQKSPLSSEDILQFLMYIVITATHDISIRLKYDIPVEQPASMEPEQVQSSLFEIDAKFSDELDHEGNNDAGLLTQPAAMVEETESPHPTPENPQPKQKGLLSYFKQVVNRLTSPTRSSAQRPSSNDSDKHSHSSRGSAQSSPSVEVSASWGERGDEEVEACFADTSSERSSTSAAIDGVQAQNDLTAKTNEDSAAPSATKSSPSKRKVEEIADISRATKVPKVASNETFFRKDRHFSVAIDPKMSWRDMRLQMTNDGMTYVTGNGLSSYFLVHPALVGIKKAQLISQYKEGEDYFASEESLVQYARDKLGWDGEFESETVPEGRRRSRAEPIKVKSPPKRAGSKRESPPTKKARKSPNANAKMTAAHKNKQFTANSVDEASLILPDNESTIQGRLLAAQMTLHPGFEGNFCAVSSKTSQISQFMENAVLTGRAGFMYVCGRPGAGKTTVISKCCHDIQDWAKNEGHDVPRMSSVNVSSLSASSKDGIMKAMLTYVAKKLGIEEDPSIHALQKQAKKTSIILIIDEIDMLIKKQGSDGERFFRELVQLANNEHLNFSLIGISNSVNDDSASRIREIASPQELVFPSYDEKGLIDIITSRIGVNTVDGKALELVSKKIAATSGDARKALETVSSACQRCQDTLSEEELSKDVVGKDSPPVKIKHMMWAIREGNLIKHAEVIRRLPQLAKVLLCIAVAYSNAMGPNAEVTLAQLKRLCYKSTDFALFDESDLGLISGLCETLCDCGLLRVVNDAHFDPHDPHAKLSFGVQMDDVECALEESLVNGENGAFYSRMMDYVQRKQGSW